jgi:hypothetical protein
LEGAAEHRGWQVVAVYEDAGISGAKGRDKRPGLDQMLKDATRRKFDVVMAWSGRWIRPLRRERPCFKCSASFPNSSAL